MSIDFNLFEDNNAASLNDYSVINLKIIRYKIKIMLKMLMMITLIMMILDVYLD